MGFPSGSAGKESACNVGDLGSIPGLGRSPGEGRGYPLQYSWASLVARLVKNLPAMWGTWVRSLGWEDQQEKGKAIYSSILAWRIPWTVQSIGSQRIRARLSNFHFHTYSVRTGHTGWLRGSRDSETWPHSAAALTSHKYMRPTAS